jgi:hypothetical protein
LSRARAAGSDGEGLRCPAAAFQELPDLHHIFPGQGVVIAMEHDFLASQVHFDPVAAFHVQIRAERGQGMLGVLEFDIGADRVSEESVEDFAFVMMHLSLKSMLSL